MRTKAKPLPGSWQGQEKLKLTIIIPETPRVVIKKILMIANGFVGDAAWSQRLVLWCFQKLELKEV